jgi:hypothetical protein
MILSMKLLFNRINSRRKHIVKLVLIVGLILFSSVFISIISQLIEPYILRRHFENYRIGIVNIEQNTNQSTQTAGDYDFSLFGQANSIEHINTFESCLMNSSLRIYDLYEPDSFNYYSLSRAYINETKLTKILGFSDSFYDHLLSIREDNTTIDNEVIVVNLNQSALLSLGNVTIKIDDQYGNVNITDKISVNNYLSNLPILNELINESNLNYLLFLRSSDYTYLWENVLNFSHEIHVEGFVKFSENQRDIMYWSLNSQKRINKFIDELHTSLISIESSLILIVSNKGEYILEDNHFLVQIIHSFIRGLQIIIWGFSILITVISINKIQRLNKEHEINTLLAGTNWSKRIIHLIAESFTITLFSLLFSMILLYPILKFQSLFAIDFIFNFSLLRDYGIITSILFLVIFIVFLDYELYLRKVISNKTTMNIKYQPLFVIPLYGKIICSGILILFFWLLNRNYDLKYLLGLYVGTLVLCGLVILIITSMINLSLKLIRKIKRKRDKKLSKTFILFTFWKKPISTKFILYSVIVTLVLASFISISLFADTIKTENRWYMGSEIIFDVPLDNSTTIESQLNTNQEIIDYTKTIKISSNQSLFEPALVEDAYIRYIGINYDDYLQYFDSWKKKNWLQEGVLVNNNENTTFITSKFKENNYEMNDILTLKDNSNITIKGIIDAWPTFTSPDGSTSNVFYGLILDYTKLQSLLNLENIDYNIKYLVHTKKTHILSVVSSISNFTFIDELSYIDPLVEEGITKVFFNPTIISFELLIIFGISMTLYSNLEEINSGKEARDLGIIAINNSYGKPLILVKLMEVIINVIIFVIVFLILFSTFYVIFSLIMSNYVMISRNTYLNLIIMTVIYIGIHLLQSLSEYLNYRRINLSLLYRHPE